MNEQLVFGLSASEISILSSIGQIIISAVALFLTIVNLRILRRLNIVDSMRRVNDKYTELNILEIENEELITFNHMYNESKLELTKEQVLEKKRINMLYNQINVLEGVFVEMKYKTMKKEHALKILNWFCPTLVNTDKGNDLIRNSGYDDDFVQFCLKYEKPKPTTKANDEA